ncbi:hypothetical protein BU23DRAFT_568931 [Bimuria novae-zelandiae CBS 107.79]|uniref:Uncharacterized protein n=1 Tax=Bimuria novae-zelandiae CBS 107.79 TaxID=1447943 RepID=A0A6A5V6P4_9PLEO|nr:hypothetical protein BU23DRAFT_568931 [Bimuria novae-zelandiae CBS 107.79]
MACELHGYGRDPANYDNFATIDGLGSSEADVRGGQRTGGPNAERLTPYGARDYASGAIAENGYCRYNDNRFGDICDVGALQRECMVLHDENMNLQITMRVMNNQNDQCIHRIERESLQRKLQNSNTQLANAHIKINWTTRQLHQAHTLLVQNGLPIPSAEGPLEVPSSGFERGFESENILAAGATTHELSGASLSVSDKQGRVRDPVVCQLFLHGKCNNKAEKKSDKQDGEVGTFQAARMCSSPLSSYHAPGLELKGFEVMPISRDVSHSCEGRAYSSIEAESPAD